MIDPNKIKSIAKLYDDFKICVLGSHSALEIMDGAKDEGLKTIVICKKGREKTYKRFKRIIDEIIIIDKFEMMLTPTIAKMINIIVTVVLATMSCT